jgi:hypothetical protein
MKLFIHVPDSCDRPILATISPHLRIRHLLSYALSFLVQFPSFPVSPRQLEGCAESQRTQLDVVVVFSPCARGVPNLSFPLPPPNHAPFHLPRDLQSSCIEALSISRRLPLSFLHDTPVLISFFCIYPEAYPSLRFPSAFTPLLGFPFGGLSKTYRISAG